MNTPDEHVVTVMFDPPFWIVLFENVEKGKYSVAREVIGTSEPTSAEIMLFFDKLNFKKIRYTIPVEGEKAQRNKISFKKMRKRVKKATEQSGNKHIYSKVHEELKKQQAHNKQERKSINRKKREEEKNGKLNSNNERKNKNYGVDRQGKRI